MIFSTSEKDIAAAADILAHGGIVAIPTETVYGLGADALDAQAVAGIFRAKGRPADNPLIVHIADAEDLDKYAVATPEAYRLAEAFWPGPLTMILKKRDVIPDIVSAGLDTVAIRCPSDPTARRIIRLAGVPIAAPSANISGSPSPTAAKHVIHDFADRIDGVVDGGPCERGVESTVVSLVSDPPTLLRPGYITPEQLREYLPRLHIAQAVVRQLPDGEKALSPGLKHKHYAPAAYTTCVTGPAEHAARCINRSAYGYRDICVICFDEEKDMYPGLTVITYGGADDPAAQARGLFTALRTADAHGADRLFVRAKAYDGGVGLAVYNRLLRACGFNVIDAQKQHMTKVLGVTGPTGSGKSMLLQLAAENGCATISADEVYAYLLPELTDDIAAEFGSDILDRNGAICRRALAKKAFSCPEATARLCQITHPAVAQAVKERLSRLQDEGTERAVIEAIALVESGLSAACDLTLTVYSEYEVRLRRIMNRDGLTREQAKERIDAQKPLDYFISHTDLALLNDDTPQFKTEAARIISRL